VAVNQSVFAVKPA